MNVTSNLSQRFPTFSRLLSRESRFRSAWRFGWRFCLCGLAALCSMLAMVGTALAIYYHVWGSLEILTPSLSIVLPVSLLVSTIVASFLGAQVGLSRPVRAGAVLCGLLLFFWAADIAGGGFEPMMAQEDAVAAAYGESTVSAAAWGLMAVWTAVGLGIGASFCASDTRRVARTLVTAMGILAIGTVLLGTIFYPMVVEERNELEFMSQRISDLGKRLHELQEANSPGGGEESRIDN